MKGIFHCSQTAKAKEYLRPIWFELILSL